MLLLCLGLSASHSWAGTIVCKHEKTVRTLRSDQTTEGGCVAVYTKTGVDQVVGSSSRPNGCESILEGIRKNLESNVWKCKEVQAARLSDLSE